MINLYWWKHEANFGDELSPMLCHALSGHDIRFAEPGADCDLVAIGSILQHVNGRAFRGAVWGTGLIDDQDPPPLDHASTFAVRGKETAKLLGVTDVSLGDPGLLCNLFASPKPKHFKLGVIPHYVDQGNAAVQQIVDSSDDFTLIDITAGVQNVIDRVAKCEVIAASCLHGLIVSDSLGIPNAWIELSDKVLGGGFKFRDYYSIYDIETPTPAAFSTTEDADAILAAAKNYNRPGLESIQSDLTQTFPVPKHGTSPYWMQRRVRNFIRRGVRQFKTGFKRSKQSAVAQQSPESQN